MKILHTPALTQCAAKLESRYKMHCVALRLFGDRPYLETTDGRIMMRAPLALEPGEKFPTDEAGEPWLLLLDAADLKAALKAGGKHATRSLRVTRPEGAVEMHVVARGTSSTYQIRSQLAGCSEYPNTDAVLASTTKGKRAEVTLNLDFLRTLLAGFGDAQNDTGCTLVTLHVGERGDPVRLTLHGTRDDAPEGPVDGFGMIMPITPPKR